jgi:pimeloyl-ACP methyl ester carboxylesterase
VNADHRTVSVNGIRLHYVEAGAGPRVVLLHGFPEFWFSWRHQIPALAAAGFRAIAPDLRGYNESERPSRVRDYRVQTIVADIAGLIVATGPGPAFVVGHDWGGVIAWRLASLYPERVAKLAILNAPHPAAYRRLLRHGLGQWLRSWYILAFQIPGLAEWLIRRGDFAMLDRLWRRQPRRPFSDAEIAEYKKALAVPSGLTGPLNYYRAALRYPGDLYREPQSVTMPTLVLWGMQDPYLSPALADVERWVPELRVQRFDDATHWLQHDAPEQVNEQLVRFFGNPG